MPDIATITAALSGIKTATEIATILRSSDASLAAAEQKAKLADLVSALADVKIELASVRELLLEKDQEIKALSESFKTRGSLEYRKPYYVLVEGEEEDGPFCQQCYDNGGKLIRLQGEETHYWRCRTCHASYQGREHPDGKHGYRQSGRVTWG